MNANIDFFLQHIRSVLEGQEIIHHKENDLDHRVIRSLGELEDLVAEIEETCEDNLIAIDSEWNGRHPQNSNAYPRCLQISWKHKTAACIALAPQTEDCELARLCYYKGKDFERLLNSTRRVIFGRRIAEHFIEADLEYLIPFGLDLRENFAVPASWEEYQKAWKSQQPCGFDTGRAIHALSETADFSLKAQARERTEAGRYDKELDDWIAAHTVKNGEGNQGKKRLDGFGIIPDDPLYTYAGYDADVTRRLALIYGDMLDEDSFGNNCWRPFWLSMRALPAIIEINCTGLSFNWERLEELTKQYTDKSEQLIQDIREWARWPEFNPRSAFQMRELLFGTRYNRKTLSKAEMKKLEPGEIPPEYVRLRPPGAKSMELKPLFTTGKYPRKWDEVIDSGRDHLATPSTNKHTLAQLLFFQHKREITDESGKTRTLNFKPVLEKLRNWNTVAQTLRYVLKPPVKDEETNEPVYDDEGNLIYDAGIPSCVCDDDRVRTHIWPTKATGRWSSANPSLQNLGKGVENLLQDIFKEEYKHPLRSLFRAAEGHLFVRKEVDFFDLFYAINQPPSAAGTSQRGIKVSDSDGLAEEDYEPEGPVTRSSRSTRRTDNRRLEEEDEERESVARYSRQRKRQLDVDDEDDDMDVELEEETAPAAKTKKDVRAAAVDKMRRQNTTVNSRSATTRQRTASFETHADEFEDSDYDPEEDAAATFGG